MFNFYNMPFFRCFQDQVSFYSKTFIALSNSHSFRNRFLFFFFHIIILFFLPQKIYSKETNMDGLNKSTPSSNKDKKLTRSTSTFSKEERKELIIATEATYPPFEFMNAESQIVGFDIDIIKAICKKLGYKCKIVHQPFETLLLGVQTSKFDLAIGGLAINEERSKQVDFSDFFYTDYFTLIFHKNSNLKLSKTSLKNKTIGIQVGTVFEIYLKEKYCNSINIKLYASINEALLDLKNKRLDACLGDSSVVKYWLLQNSLKNKYKTIDIIEENYKSAMAIAVKKGNKALLAKINNALKEIKKTDDFNKISGKYFGRKKVQTSKFIIQLIYGAGRTIQIALISLLLGIILSIFFVLLKLLGNEKFEKIIDFFLIIIRGLPEIVVILFAYYGIPYLLSYLIPKLEISPVISSCFALGLIFSSYASKVFVGIYRDIPSGQIKSGLVLGLTKFTIIRRIIFPQVIIQTLPSINNLWLILLKDTSIVALVGLSEIMGRAKLAANSTGMSFTFFAIAALIYLTITTISYFIMKRIENSLVINEGKEN